MVVSKHYDLQKSLFGEIVFDNDFHKIKTPPGRMNDDGDFNNTKIYKIYNVLNDILYIGVTCDALKTCLFKNNKESKLKRSINYKFYNMFNNGLNFVKIELITNFLFDREYNLRCKQNEIVNQMINNLKMNKNK